MYPFQNTLRNDIYQAKVGCTISAEMGMGGKDCNYICTLRDERASGHIFWWFEAVLKNGKKGCWRLGATYNPTYRSMVIVYRRVTKGQNK